MSSANFIMIQELSYLSVVKLVQPLGLGVKYASNNHSSLKLSTRAHGRRVDISFTAERIDREWQANLRIRTSRPGQNDAPTHLQVALEALGTQVTSWEKRSSKLLVVIWNHHFAECHKGGS